MTRTWTRPSATAFFYTVGYKDLDNKALLEALMRCGIIAIPLNTTGSGQCGIRVCVSRLLTTKISSAGRASETVCKISEQMNYVSANEAVKLVRAATPSAVRAAPPSPSSCRKPWPAAMTNSGGSRLSAASISPQQRPLSASPNTRTRSW